jgi:hypothetical protein
MNYREQDRLARMVRRETLLAKQFIFLETRTRAIEDVISSLSMRDVFLVLLGRLSLRSKIDEAHMRIYQGTMAEQERVGREAMMAPKIVVPAGVNGRV